eukprot:2137613-Prorocentrum_lima.AAC.1
MRACALALIGEQRRDASCDGTCQDDSEPACECFTGSPAAATCRAHDLAFVSPEQVAPQRCRTCVSRSRGT